MFEALEPELKDSVVLIEQRLLALRRKAALGKKSNDSLFLEIENVTQEIEALIQSSGSSNLTKTIDKPYVEYILTEKEVYSLDNFTGEFRMLRLGTLESLLELKKEFDVQILDKKSALNVGGRLYEFLLNNIEPIPENFAVIPDGLLSTLPFTMLVNKGDPLVYQHQIDYYWHAEQFERSDLQDFDNNILIYEPQYDQLPAPSLALTRDSEYALSHTSVEVDQISEIYKDRCIVLNSGNRDSLINGLKSAQVFHFAGHAKTTGGEPVMILKNKNGQRITWSADEILHSRNSLELAVLSACETGLGKYYLGEGIMSLARSFQESGASATLMSLWSVDDQSTTAIMSKFYRYLRSGYTKSTSLRKAQLDFLSIATPEQRAPYYWAGFVLVGNDRPLSNKNTIPWVRYLLGMVIVGIGVNFSRKLFN